MAICAFLEHWNLLEKVFWRLETGAGYRAALPPPVGGGVTVSPKRAAHSSFLSAHPGRMRRKKGGIPTALTQFQSTVPA